MKFRFLLAVAVLMLVPTAGNTKAAHTKQVITCTGILIEVDTIAGADYSMSVIYDKTDDASRHTCVIDVGRAGHWPLRGSCEPGETCTISGPYFKKIGNTYYLRSWDKIGQQ